jgi:hypothetical protein
MIKDHYAGHTDDRCKPYIASCMYQTTMKDEIKVCHEALKMAKTGKKANLEILGYS